MFKHKYISFFHVDRLYEVIEYSIKAYTTQNWLGIMGYGCIYAKIFTKHKIKIQICHRIHQ